MSLFTISFRMNLTLLFYMVILCINMFCFGNFSQYKTAVYVLFSLYTANLSCEPRQIQSEENAAVYSSL